MYKLDSIIREVLLEIGESNMNKYSRVLPLGVSALREWNLDASGVAKMIELEISDVFTAPLPNDYIKYTRIAICGADGLLHSLGLCNDLCLDHTKDACGNDVVPVADTNNNNGDGIFFTGFDGFADNYRNGELVGRFFGIGGGNNNNGYYRIDEKNHVIQFSNLWTGTTSVMLEYIGTLDKIDGNYQVHPFLVESIKSWVKWQMTLNNPNSQLGRVQLLEQNYLTNKRTSIRRYNSNTVTEWAEAFRLSNSLAPRY